MTIVHLTTKEYIQQTRQSLFVHSHPDAAGTMTNKNSHWSCWWTRQTIASQQLRKVKLAMKLQQNEWGATWCYCQRATIWHWVSHALHRLCSLRLYRDLKGDYKSIAAKLCLDGHHLRGSAEQKSAGCHADIGVHQSPNPKKALVLRSP